MTNRDESFLKMMLKVGIPIAIQCVIVNCLNMVDQVIVSQLGEVALASVGIANRITTIVNFVLGALATGMSIFVAQFVGKKDLKNAGRMTGIGIISGGLVIAVMLIGCLIFPRQLLGIFTDDAKALDLAVSFLVIVALSFVPLLFSIVYSAYLRSSMKVRVPMVASIIATCCNIVFDYIFVFGKFGFRKMGVQGAALGTVIARCIELFIILIYIYAKKVFEETSVLKRLQVNAELWKKFLATALPIVVSEMLWVLGDTTYNAIYSRIGTIEYAAMSVMYPMQSVIIGLLTGISGAAVVVLGNMIGAGKEDNLLACAKKVLIFGFVVSVMSGILVIIFTDAYVSIYNVSPETIVISKRILKVFGCIIWIKITNMIIGNGVLSSGGDSRFILVMDSISTWAIGVPLGLISAFVLHMSIEQVYLLICFEEFIRVFVGLYRIKSKKWIHNLVKEEK